MGIFESLFEKKECAICGGEIGLLGNRKLEDGNMCKTCAQKLSPWFSDRRNSTVTEIKEQLAYREENRKKAAQFRVTKSFGEDMKVLIDEPHRWFMVTRAGNLAEANPDVIDLSSLVDCSMHVDEHRSEITRTDKDGKRVSYTPPRYEFSYDFTMTIRVNTPYFDEIKFSLNGSRDVRLVSEMPGSAGFFSGSRSMGIDPSYNVEYRKYVRMGEELCETLSELRDKENAPNAGQNLCSETGREEAAAAEVPAAAPAGGPWTCQACGAPNSGKFCESCGSPRPQ